MINFKIQKKRKFKTESHRNKVIAADGIKSINSIEFTSFSYSDEYGLIRKLLGRVACS